MSNPSVTTQCPFIDIDIVPNPEFNERRESICPDGTAYIFYYHWDGFDRKYNCQFCKLIGRKRDVFQCLNENEWKQCPHYCSKTNNWSGRKADNG